MSKTLALKCLPLALFLPLALGALKVVTPTVARAESDADGASTGAGNGIRRRPRCSTRASRR